MNKIAILYGPTGGNTERAARMIAGAFGELSTELIPVKEAGGKDLSPYLGIIFGGPTVGSNTWADSNQRNDWDLFLTQLHKMNLHGKKCAVFGLGDHVSYSFYFVDDIGVMADRILETGGTLIGSVGPEGYTFDESKAFRDGKFAGLPLDEDNEPEKTEDRINRWVEQLKKEF
ncbi:MAG: flavodoxin [Bacteroidales bacterium]|nr:flavodoxin [Bacteroidales bacterium]